MRNKQLRLKEIAEYINGELHGDGEIEITSLAGIMEAQPGELTFLANKKYSSYIKKTNASAIILSRDQVKDVSIPYIIVDDPYFAFTLVMRQFYGSGFPNWNTGISPNAHISEDVSIGSNVTIMPFAYIGSGTKIADNVKIGVGVFIGDNVEIGENTAIYPNVSIIKEIVIGKNVIIHSGAVIGADGFGFARREGKNIKIPQVGKIIIEDDVEIGANVCIDRATLGATRIRRGTKIDNLVMIAHNVEIGEQSLIVAQVGISGSVKVGDRVTLAGQVGVAGHLNIGDDTVVAAKSGISKSIPPNSFYAGHPARPYQDEMRIKAHLEKLPALSKKVKELEERLSKLEGNN